MIVTQNRIPKRTYWTQFFFLFRVVSSAFGKRLPCLPAVTKLAAHLLRTLSYTQSNSLKFAKESYFNGGQVLLGRQIAINWNRTNLEYLKAINVKHSNAELFVWFLDGFIYGLKKTGRKWRWLEISRRIPVFSSSMLKRGQWSNLALVPLRTQEGICA